MKTLQDAIHEINKNLTGQSPHEIITDSKIYRFGKKDSCWYAANTWEYKGNSYFTVNYGDWKNGSEFVFKSFDNKTGLNKNFIIAQQKKITENQAKLSHEKQTIQKECREKWQPKFNDAKKSYVHEYLENKKINSLFTAKIDHNGTLLIPVYDHEKFNGVQMIFKDPETQTMVKRFARGIKIKGGICPLKRFKDAEYVYLSEGFATAASIQMAFPNIPSICAFNAGNLAEAINTIRFVNPACKIIIAADSDENGIGEKKARYCQKYFSDTIYKKVLFPHDAPKEWSDFNDLHCFQSLMQVKEQLEIDPNEFAFVEPLGHDEESGKYFYISSANTQIIPLKASEHSESGFCRIIANENYWLTKYAGQKKDDDDKKPQISWSRARFDLMEQCQKVGEFNPQKLRGVGLWKDKDNYVWNNGLQIFDKPIDSDFLYRKGSKVNVHKVDYDKIKVQKTLNNLREAIESLKYINPNDAIVLNAWIIQAQIFTVMPWRFWVWLIGNKGTGKSSVLKTVGKLAPNYIFSSDATESGITQTIKSNATAIILDEIESSTEGVENRKLHGIKDLMRRMNTNEIDDQKLRGTAGGVSIAHNTQACFLLGSIKSNVRNPADQSRIFFIEMDTIENQPQEDWLKIQKVINYAHQMKSEIFSYCFDRIDTILNNKQIILNYLKAEKKLESRAADQLSSMMACFNVFLKDDIITNGEIETMIENYGLFNSRYIEDNQINGDDDDAAYDDLMGHIIDTRDQHTVERIIEIIENPKSADCELFKNLLWTHGLIYKPKNKTLFISSKGNIKNLKSKKLDLSFYNVLRRSKKYCFNNNATAKTPSDRKTVRGIEIFI